MTAQPGGSGAPFRSGWRVFRAQPEVFVASSLVLFASWAALEVAVIALHRLGVIVNLLLHAAFLLIFCGLLAGLHGMAQRAIAGGTPETREIASCVGRGPAFLGALALYLLALAAGLLLLVVPGLVAAVRWGLFGHVLGARKASPIEALREAAALSDGRLRRVAGFMLKALALNLAGAALAGVGVFVTYPVTLLASADLYRSLRAAAPDGSKGA